MKSSSGFIETLNKIRGERFGGVTEYRTIIIISSNLVLLVTGRVGWEVLWVLVLFCRHLVLVTVCIWPLLLVQSHNSFPLQSVQSIKLYLGYDIRFFVFRSIQ